MTQGISAEESAKIIEFAKKTFTSVGYEYRRGGDGDDTDNDTIPEIDCSHMVYAALKVAGIDISYGNVQTSSLNSRNAHKYFSELTPEEVVPGDLVVFDGHVGIVEQPTGILKLTS